MYIFSSKWKDMTSKAFLPLELRVNSTDHLGIYNIKKKDGHCLSLSLS